MKKEILVLLAPALLVGALSSCGNSPLTKTVEAKMVLPTAIEYEGNKLDSLHLVPSFESVGGARFGFQNDIELVDEHGSPLSWLDVGLGQTATITYGEGGTIKKAVVRDDGNDVFYLWHGKLITDGVSAYFVTADLTFVYAWNWSGETLPEHVAMKLNTRENVVLDILYQREGSSVYFSPNPSGFAGYVNLDL